MVTPGAQGWRGWRGGGAKGWGSLGHLASYTPARDSLYRPCVFAAGPAPERGNGSRTVRREAGADKGTLARRSPASRSRYGLHARRPRRFALARTRRRASEAPPPGSQQHPSASGSGERGKGKYLARADPRASREPGRCQALAFRRSWRRASQSTVGRGDRQRGSICPARSGWRGTRGKARHFSRGRNT